MISSLLTNYGVSGSIFRKEDMVEDQEIDERIAKCEKILSSNPGSQIFAALAEAHRRKGDLDKAFQVCQKGLKSHPAYGSAHVVMAKINLDKGLYDWAETEVEKAAKQGGNIHAIGTLRCEILIAKGELEQAEREIRKQLKRNPENTQLKKLLESLQQVEQKPADVKFPGNIATELAARSKRKKRQPLGAKPKAGETAGETLAINETAGASTPAVKLSAMDVLEKGIELDGVFGAVQQTVAGEILDSCWEVKEHEEEYGSAACEAFRSVSATLERVTFGECQTVLVESKGVKMYFLVSGDDYFVFFANPATTTNRLRANLNRIWKAFEGNPLNDSQGK